MNGFVYITNVTAVASPAGAITKTMNADGVTVKSIEANGYGTKLTITVLASPGAAEYKPVVTVNGAKVTNLARQTNGDWTGTVVIWIAGETEIVARHEDGDEYVVPLITDATTTTSSSSTSSSTTTL